MVDLRVAVSGQGLAQRRVAAYHSVNGANCGNKVVVLNNVGSMSHPLGRACGWMHACKQVIALLVALSTGVAAVPAMAGPTLLVDDATGHVLYAEQPDQSWYPASLTKLMTIYVTLAAVKAGKVTMATAVPLSEKARGQPATRIGLRLGIELNVEQAVRGLILRSANDFSMGLAELIGGSEEGFAEIMNATAKQLGMTRSHFTNPHGLPDPAQMSTARDMAVLARAMHKDFPERAEMFSTPSFIIHRGTFHSQNDLLRTLPGADGMKTGFTCGAGYNVVVSATREGRRIIAVVLGEAMRDERSLRAAALIEHGFAVAEWKRVLGAPMLEKLALDPPTAQPVHDMSKETKTRTCGNLGRRLRQVAQARALKAPAKAPASQSAAQPTAVGPKPAAAGPAPAKADAPRVVPAQGQAKGG